MAHSAAHHIETVVLGAGVVGLAVARALAIAGKEVLIVEREPTIGTGTSSRNSEVIHAGIYYPFGSHKARLCISGRNMLYDYCTERNIPYERKTKIIVATNQTQMQNAIPQILNHAKANGVEDLIKLSREDVKTNFEPEINCEGGIFSPSTGIIDSHSFMVSLLADAEEYGATIALNCNVDNASVSESSTKSKLGGNITIRSSEMDLHCDTLINCAGLYSGKVASWLFDSANSNGSKNDKSVLQPSRQYYAKGNYYRLAGQKAPFRHLIYPVPEKGGLGIHATIDLGGNIRFGPDVDWIDQKIKDPTLIDLSVDPKRADLFYAEVRKYWPSLQDGALVPDYAGIRPKLVHPNCPSHSFVSEDFLLQGSREHGVKGFVNLMGIESPGLTASMAIANAVVELVNADEK